MEAAVHCIFNFRIIFSPQSKEKYLSSIPDLLRLAVSSLHSVPSFCTSNFIFNNNTQFQMVCKHHLNTCLIKSCNNKISFLFCLWRSKIASDRFLAIPGKVFTGRPVVTHRKKSWTHPAGEGAIWTYSTPKEAAQAQKLLSLQWLPLYEPRVSPPWVHLFWALGEHRCKQCACAPWASHTSSPGAQSSVQVLTWQFPYVVVCQ